MPKPFLLGPIANERYSRQIVSRGTGATGVGTAGGVSVSVPWPTTAGSVAANVLTFLFVALKPGTANLGAIATPAGWDLVASHIGGGYGSSLAVNTGNVRCALFSKQDNTAAGSQAVSITPNGANGVACGSMNRIEKLSGTWQSVATATGEATVDAQIGSFAPSSLIYTPGDFLIYGFGIGFYFAASAALTAGDATDIAGTTPSLARGSSANVGFNVDAIITGRRALRGLALPTQLLDSGVGNICRGPMVVARYRVR